MIIDQHQLVIVRRLVIAGHHVQCVKPTKREPVRTPLRQRVVELTLTTIKWKAAQEVSTSLFVLTQCHQ